MEYRTGLINVSPIGRNCSQSERIEFNDFNKKAQVLETFKQAALEKFGEKFGLKMAIGGQISFDVFPIVIICITNRAGIKHIVYNSLIMIIFSSSVIRHMK